MVRSTLLQHAPAACSCAPRQAPAAAPQHGCALPSHAQQGTRTPVAAALPVVDQQRHRLLHAQPLHVQAVKVFQQPLRQRRQGRQGGRTAVASTTVQQMLDGTAPAPRHWRRKSIQEDSEREGSERHGSSAVGWQAAASAEEEAEQGRAGARQLGDRGGQRQQALAVVAVTQRPSRRCQ